MMPREDEVEQEPAMSKYRFFMRCFANNFVTIVNECWVTPTFIFQKALVDFAAVILNYKTIEYSTEDLDSIDERFTPKAMYHNLRQHFLHNWPTLESYFERAIKNPGVWLSWKKANITILARTPEVVQDLTTRGLEEKAYLPTCNIFCENDSPDDAPTAGTSQKRSRQDHTPPTTPSSGARRGRKRTRRRRSSAIVVEEPE